MYFLNLHGNLNFDENAPDGINDENVFDQIQQGISINILVKKSGIDKRVFYADWWGEREDKYKLAWESDFKEVLWQELKPNFPFYFFVPKNEANRETYDEFWKVDEIFSEFTTGLVTARDSLNISFTSNESYSKVKEFTELKEEEARGKFNLKKDSRDWTYKTALKDAQNNLNPNKVVRISYRPFDNRYTLYTGNSRGLYSSPQKNIMQNLLNTPNIALITAKKNRSSQMNHFFVNKYITEAKCGESTTQSYTFPLFLTRDKQATGTATINFTSKFLKFLNENCKENTPEQIFGYIYAILYSPTYRKKYSEFLKSDFPKIPFTKDKEVFQQLSKLGAQLVILHTAENKQDSWEANSLDDFEIFTTKQSDKQQIGSYIGSGPNHTVDEVRFELLKEHEMPEEILQKLMPEEKHWGRIYFSQNKYFNYVPQSAWQMQIGGYFILEKWLKYRQNRELSGEESNSYPQIIKSLCATLQIMKQIDSFTESWI
ncbi:MAG: hypothetical protein JNM14_05325 [Ferruginibacter sp.]|nr:hypothetical protein [Ferruginibacter sp.]